eukprot:TRINITY_DN34640_c0_g1_i1.p1 TRINITY_DN34640_c0_g1~~TRINITY_DN34640_c0_g1_i1.p1  ORF type:complete len:260 (-),score=46.02 TRINITY_DN34640_c0_g1_i1:12-755(-)
MTEEEGRAYTQELASIIENTAREEAKAVIDKAKEEYQIETEKLIAQARIKIKTEYEDKLNKYSINKRIEKSARSNQCRIKKMSARNKCVNDMVDTTGEQLAAYFQNNKEKYRQVLKQLMVQGLIKLMEVQVGIRCRKSDTEIIESIIPEAAQEYVGLLKKEVPRLAGREIKCKITINTQKYLPEYNEKETGLPSCCGGLELTAKQGKIVCTNTIDARLELCFQEALPDIRRLLFPSQLEKQLIYLLS